MLAWPRYTLPCVTPKYLAASLKQTLEAVSHSNEISLTERIERWLFPMNSHHCRIVTRKSKEASDLVATARIIVRETLSWGQSMSMTVARAMLANSCKNRPSVPTEITLLPAYRRLMALSAAFQIRTTQPLKYQNRWTLVSRMKISLQRKKVFPWRKIESERRTRFYQRAWDSQDRAIPQAPITASPSSSRSEMIKIKAGNPPLPALNGLFNKLNTTAIAVIKLWATLHSITIVTQLNKITKDQMMEYALIGNLAHFRRLML